MGSSAKSKGMIVAVHIVSEDEPSRAAASRARRRRCVASGGAGIAIGEGDVEGDAARGGGGEDERAARADATPELEDLGSRAARGGGVLVPRLREDLVQEVRGERDGTVVHRAGDAEDASGKPSREEAIELDSQLVHLGAFHVVVRTRRTRCSGERGRSARRTRRTLLLYGRRLGAKARGSRREKTAEDASKPGRRARGVDEGAPRRRDRRRVDSRNSTRTTRARVFDGAPRRAVLRCDAFLDEVTRTY